MSLLKKIGKSIGIIGLIGTLYFIGNRMGMEGNDYKKFHKNSFSAKETVGLADSVFISYDGSIKTMEVERLFGSNFEMQLGAYDEKLNELGLTTKRDYKYKGHLSSHMNQARESLASKVEKDDTHQELVRKIKINDLVFYRQDGPKEFFEKADKLWGEYWNKAEGNRIMKEWEFYNSSKQQKNKKIKEAIDAL